MLLHAVLDLQEALLASGFGDAIGVGDLLVNVLGS
jgi:hypothetical protein